MGSICFNFGYLFLSPVFLSIAGIHGVTRSRTGTIEQLICADLEEPLLVKSDVLTLICPINTNQCEAPFPISL